MAVLMRPVAFGRPGTRVIPDGWAEAHQPVAEKTMTATIALREPGGTLGTFDPDTGTRPMVPHQPYATVGCRVQALTNQAREVDTAGEPVTISGYLIAVPASVTASVDDLGTVTGSGDASLDGRTIHVDDVARGSLRFERDLFCTISS